MKNLFFVSLFMASLFSCSIMSGEEEKATKEDINTVSVVGKEVTYQVDTLTMKGYIVSNELDTSLRPGVLVVHEWWGHNDYSRERANMLADLGYVAMAIDMYGNGKQAKHPEEAGNFSRMVMSDFNQAKLRFEAALETLKKHPQVDTEKIGAVGYCFGGAVVLSMANAGIDLKAVASFHGGLRLPIMPKKDSVKAKILVANGDADKFISEEQIMDFKAAMDAAQVDYSFINYEGAMHAFTSKGADSLGQMFNIPLAYNAYADSASWEEMKILFKEVLENGEEKI